MIGTFMTGYKNVFKMDIPSKTLENIYLEGAEQMGIESLRAVWHKKEHCASVFYAGHTRTVTGAFGRNSKRNNVMRGQNTNIMLHAFLVMYNIVTYVPVKVLRNQNPRNRIILTQ
jgi:hypothetical protein